MIHPHTVRRFNNPRTGTDIFVITSRSLKPISFTSSFIILFFFLVNGQKTPEPVSYFFLLLLAHECINQMVDWLASAAAARPPLKERWPNLLSLWKGWHMFINSKLRLLDKKKENPSVIMKTQMDLPCCECTNDNIL